MSFEELKLIPPILRAVKVQGYTDPTPIQAEAIPIILSGRDLVGCAQTGSGKTAAYSMPMLQLLYNPEAEAAGHTSHGRADHRPIRALVLSPTRELAIQIADSITAYGKYTGLRHAVVYGGVSQAPQTIAVRSGVDILVATPGRLLDMVYQGLIDFGKVEILVLDEADRMLDMGFAPDVKKIISLLPDKRQTLLFSATMPPEITSLVDSILTDPQKIAVTPVSSTVETVEQAVYFVDKRDKKDLLIKLLSDKAIDSALVFTRTKHGADKITRDLERAKITVQAIHGNKSQGARQSALNSFKAKKTRVLVATDIAARGIDVQELSHVINFDLPNIPETYVHRIGRTARAGLGGIAISLCDNDERKFLKDIQKLIGLNLTVLEDEKYSVRPGDPIKPAAQASSDGRTAPGSTSQTAARRNPRRRRRPPVRSGPPAAKPQQ